MYAYADVEHLLAIKGLQWHDSVLKFSPKPHSRIGHPASLSPADKSDDNVAVRTEEDAISDDCNVPVDDDQETFYDAMTDSVSCDKQGQNTAVEEEKIVSKKSPQHTGVSHRASASLETCKNDVDSVSIQEKETSTFEELPQHTRTGASAVKANEVVDSDTALNDTKEHQNVEVITSEISTLPLEKLKLLKKLLKKKMICKQCEVKVDLECEAVTLTGTKGDIMTTQLSIYEALTSVSERSLNISKELGCLIKSAKGQEWFDESCDRCSFVGVCYVDGVTTKLLAADDAMADAMRKWLVDALVSERKSFARNHLSFLQTHIWMNFVQKCTASQLLQITVEASKMEILVEGLTDAVKTAVKEIDALLNMQCHMDKKLPLKPADYRTLSLRSTDIVNQVQDLVMQQQR